MAPLDRFTKEQTGTIRMYCSRAVLAIAVVFLCASKSYATSGYPDTGDPDLTPIECSEGLDPKKIGGTAVCCEESEEGESTCYPPETPPVPPTCQLGETLTRSATVYTNANCKIEYCDGSSANAPYYSKVKFVYVEARCVNGVAGPEWGVMCITSSTDNYKCESESIECSKEVPRGTETWTVSEEFDVFVNTTNEIDTCN